MKEFIRKFLKENLEYHHVDDATADEFKLTELEMPTMSLSKPTTLSDLDIKELKNLDYNTIDFEQITTSSPIKLKVILPWENDLEKGIALDLQIVKDNLFQIHISIDDNLQSYGLGYKIYKSLITQFGHLYSGKGRRQNGVQVPKIWGKLSNEPGITCHSNDHMEICILDVNPDKDKLLKLVN